MVFQLKHINWFDFSSTFPLHVHTHYYSTKQTAAMPIRTVSFWLNTAIISQSNSNWWNTNTLNPERIKKKENKKKRKKQRRYIGIRLFDSVFFYLFSNCWVRLMFVCHLQYLYMSIRLGICLSNSHHHHIDTNLIIFICK